MVTIVINIKKGCAIPQRHHNNMVMHGISTIKKIYVKLNNLGVPPKIENTAKMKASIKMNAQKMAYKMESNVTIFLLSLSFLLISHPISLQKEISMKTAPTKNIGELSVHFAKRPVVCK